jgi:hypothetical protein
VLSVARIRVKFEFRTTYLDDRDRDDVYRLERRREQIQPVDS